MEVFGEDVTNKEVDQMKMPSQMNLAPVLIIIKKLPFIQIRIMMIADQKKTSINDDRNDDGCEVPSADVSRPL